MLKDQTNFHLSSKEVSSSLICQSLAKGRHKQIPRMGLACDEFTNVNCNNHEKQSDPLNSGFRPSSIVVVDSSRLPLERANEIEGQTEGQEPCLDQRPRPWPRDNEEELLSRTSHWPSMDWEPMQSTTIFEPAVQGLHFSSATVKQEPSGNVELSHSVQDIVAPLQMVTGYTQFPAERGRFDIMPSSVAVRPEVPQSATLHQTPLPQFFESQRDQTPTRLGTTNADMSTELQLQTTSIPENVQTPSMPPSTMPDKPSRPPTEVIDLTVATSRSDEAERFEDIKGMDAVAKANDLTIGQATSSVHSGREKPAKTVKPQKSSWLSFIVGESNSSLNRDSPISRSEVASASLGKFFMMVAERRLLPTPVESIISLTFIQKWGHKKVFLVSRDTSESDWNEVKEEMLDNAWFYKQMSGKVIEKLRIHVGVEVENEMHVSDEDDE